MCSSTWNCDQAQVFFHVHLLGSFSKLSLKVCSTHFYGEFPWASVLRVLVWLIYFHDMTLNNWCTKSGYKTAPNVQVVKENAQRIIESPIYSHVGLLLVSLVISPLDWLISCLQLLYKILTIEHSLLVFLSDWQIMTVIDIPKIPDTVIRDLGQRSICSLLNFIKQH